MNENSSYKVAGLRKICPLPRDEKGISPCMSPEHTCPKNIVLESGDYEYTCPTCGESYTFTVQKVICGIGKCIRSNSKEFDCQYVTGDGRCGASPFHDKKPCIFFEHD